MGGIFDRFTAGNEPTGLGSAASEADARDGAADGTSRAVREAALELMKHGVLEEARKSNVYRILVTNAERVRRIYEPLDLRLCIDEIRGLAFLAVAETVPSDSDEEWSHPLVRRQRLTLEQSLLVAILRQLFIAYELEAGIGAGEAVVTIDDLLPHLRIYLGDPGSESQEKRRLMALLEQLKGHGLVSDVDAHERVTIRPLIVHLANPENLSSLINAMRQLAGGLQGQADGEP